MDRLTTDERLEDIIDHCFPEAVEMPDDASARCDWYARRLMQVANMAQQALNAFQAAA